jgi:hypothetical protein
MRSQIASSVATSANQPDEASPGMSTIALRPRQ